MMTESDAMGRRAERSSGFDLEGFRLARGLTYRQLGALIGENHASKIRSWALGEARPDADQMEIIIVRTDGAVTVEAMHLRRLTWLRENNRCGALPVCKAKDEATDHHSDHCT
jgi:hypothetical protein